MNSFPIHEDTPPFHQDALPSSVDVAIIGGGVIGVTAALNLARAGVSVLVLEKGRVAGEQSSRNWGWIRVQGRDFAEIPIAQEAQRLWQNLAPQLDTNINLTTAGVAYLANRPQDLHAYDAWLQQAKEYGVSSKILDVKHTKNLLPAANHKWIGALYTPSDMRAEPFVAVPALARLAKKDGALIRENCAVRALDIEGGKIAGVITESGRVRASTVILAGGAWSSLLLRNHGISIPQLSVRASVARTAPLEDIFQGGAVDNNIAFRRRADGGYTLAPAGFHELYLGPDAFRSLARYLPHVLKDMRGSKYLPAAPAGYPDAWRIARHWQSDQISPFERMRILSPSPNRKKIQQLADIFAQKMAFKSDVKIIQQWAGMIDTLPDIVPIVDKAPQLPGLIVATGMCGHGFGIGPAFGRILSDMVQENTLGHDMARFRMSRFFDRSKLVLGPNL